MKDSAKLAPSGDVGLLDRTRVVLHHPFFPENIGSVARAMHNTGLTQLHLVGGASPEHPNALKLAVASGHLLADARQHASLAAAIAGSAMVIGATSHPFAGLSIVTPREASHRALAQEGPIALVFGNEKNGLTLRELQTCDVVVRIPCPTAGASLNLAQAAMILCYEWLIAGNEGGPGDALVGWRALAPQEDLTTITRLLEAALQEVGFFKPHHAASRRATLLNLLSRLRLEPREAALLRTLARKLDHYFRRHPV